MALFYVYFYSITLNGIYKNSREVQLLKNYLQNFYQNMVLAGDDL